MRKKSTARRLKGVLSSITILYVLMILGVAGFLSYGIMYQFEEFMLKQTSSLIAANSTQLELNINAYLEKIEKNVALMYSDEAYYAYDATNSRLDEYDKIQKETAITNRIIDLGLMENYADFCIVYSDNHTVGWLSKTTESMYAGGDMYSDMASRIVDMKSQAAWCTSIQDNFNRMYYVKRLNEHAVLFASFYGNELASVFEYPEELSGMIIRLVDEKRTVLYSSETEEIGTVLPAEQNKYFGYERMTSVVADGKLLNVAACKNGWYVMCEMPTEVVMQDFYKLKQSVLDISGIVVVLAILICWLLLIELSKPVGGIVDSLTKKATQDDLSGVMNKASYTEAVADALQSKQAAVLIMLDVDNFKAINDTKGHAYGDKFIHRMGKLLQANFAGENIWVGRLGGDEFSVFGLMDDDAKELVEKRIQIKMDFFLQEFAMEFAAEKEELNVSLSAGISDSFLCEKNFKALYEAADKALYISKQNGKDQYNYYIKEASENDEETDS